MYTAGQFAIGGVKVKLVAAIFSLFFLLSMPLAASAIALVNRDVILEAQEYGIKRKQLPLTEFLHPWIVYEEQAAILNETTERAYLYTPFLLLANDARDKARSKKTVQLADSEKILADYAGCLVFSITINGSTENFSNGIQATIKQDKKTLKPYHAVINSPVKTPWFPGEPKFTTHTYFYFNNREVQLNKPVTVVLTTKDKKERRFYFDLSNFK
ncbi:hypothetical protein [Sporomusa paucivorans]|jgi:hypothetical protein|uniref:hypothetical protein n=1 Tax=Sporomusa TaxID=2375 RepID=UPI0035710D88